MLNNLTLESDKGTTFSKVLRVLFILWGLIYFVPAIQTFVSSEALTFLVVLNGLLGAGLMATALFVVNISDPKKVTLNEEFLRIDEGTSYTRTAYWKKIDSLTLTRLNIRIRYQSGTPERFRLPFLSNNEFKNLEEWLINQTSEWNITFSKKPWWKPF